MKKTFALLVLIITPMLAPAQGIVSVANQTGLVKQWTSVTDSTLISVPTSGGYVQLLAAPQGTPLPNPLAWQPNPGSYFLPNYASLAEFLAANPGWAPATNLSGAAPVRISAITPGRFSGGIYTIGNVAPGAPADYLLIGWTGSYTSFDAALAAAVQGGLNPFLGVSAVATTSTGNPFTTPPGTAVSLGTTFAGMTLAPVVGPSGPWFPVGPPPNQQVTLGDTATFTALVQSTPPATFQWSFNGTNIAGATSTSYTITNAQYADAGTYTLLATNHFTHTSDSASPVLEVLPPAHPLSVVMLGNHAALVLTGAVGKVCQISSLPDLAPTNLWTSLTNLTLQHTLQIWTDTSVDALTQSHRYYRVSPVP